MEEAGAVSRSRQLRARLKLANAAHIDSAYRLAKAIRAKATRYPEMALPWDCRPITVASLLVA
jgi:hypothetical protein